MVMQYASIQDAWDQSVYPKSKGKQQRKQSNKVDPSCDLVSGGKCNDRSSVMNDYFDDIPYEKYEKAYKANNREKRERRVDIVTDESHYDVTEPAMVSRKKSDCKEKSVVPYGTDVYDNSFGYDQYYDMNYGSDSGADDQQQCYTTTEEEEEPRTVIPRNLVKENLYKEMILESYQDDKQVKATTGGWMELAIYIFSGVLLIIMMEQILNLGLYLK